MEKKILSKEFFIKEDYSTKEEFENLLLKNLVRDFEDSDYSITMNAYHLTDDAEKFAKALLQLKEVKELVDEKFASPKGQMSAFDVIRLLDDYFFNGPSEEDVAKMKAIIAQL